MKRAGVRVGALGVMDRRSRRFTSAQLADLETLAFQAGLLLEREELTQASARSPAAPGAGEEDYRALFEQAGDGISLTDVSGRIIDVNVRFAALVGWRREELVGRRIPDLLFTGELERMPLQLDVLRTGRRLVFERRLLHRFGHAVSAEVSVVQAAPGRILALFRDLSERRRAEEALRTAEQHLHQVLGSAPVILWAVDRDLVFTVSEGAGLASVGLRPGEAVGQSARELYVDLPEALANLERALAGESFRAVVAGRGLAFETQYFPERDASGVVVGASGLALDVSERLRSDEASRESESRYRALAENSAVGIAQLDAQGRILFANQALATLAEADSPEALMALRLSELVPHFDAANLALLEQQLSERSRGHAAAYEIAFTGFKGGQHRALVSAAPILSSEGQHLSTVASMIDVTGRWRAEQALRDSEERFRQLAEHVEAVFWITDPSLLQVHYVNPAYERIWGRTCESLLQDGAGRIEAVHPEDRLRVALAVAEFGRIHSYEETYRIVRPDGEQRWIRERAFPVRDEAGSVYRAVGSAEDVTEQRGIHESLLEAQRIARIGNWDWDITRNTLWWSDQVFRIFGLEPGEFAATYEAFLERVHPEDRDLVRNAVAASLARGSPYDIVHRVVRRDGAVRIVQERAELRSGDCGQPARMVGTVQDVTEQREVAERLAVLSSAVEQAADNVFITDREGRILYVNDACVRQCGRPREELLGQTPRAFKSGAHAPQFYEEMWRTLMAGEVFHGVVLNRRRDGTLYHEDKTIAPLRNSEGRITHFVSAGRDITERRLAEEREGQLRAALENSVGAWRATFDAVEAPVLVFDEGGGVIRSNRAARRLAATAGGETSEPPLLPAGGEPWEAIRIAHEHVRRSGEHLARSVMDARTGLHWDVSAHPFDHGAIVMARDVTGLIRLQESLRRSEHLSAMGSLLAGVAHEVRNPLFSMSATLDAFDQDFAGQPEYATYSGLLRGEVERLTHLMQELLDYGRPAPTQQLPGQLAPVLARALKACGPLARMVDVRLEPRLVDPLPDLVMDAGRLQQVFQNLIENAIQHAPAESVVTVTLGRSSLEDALLEFRVEDQGPGFRDEDLARLFEPFFTRRRGGTGLGLAIAQRIAAEHGGSVVAANQPGGGARVTVLLPLGGGDGR